MSGICGIVGEYNIQLLKKMSLAIRHRGPNEENIFAEQNIGLCARSLSLEKDTPRSLIFHNERKDIYVVCDARLEDCRELKSTLEKKGHQFDTRIDSEIIPHLYEEFQEEAIEKLRGSFAIAIWDKTKAKLILARDKFGVKPLYYFSGKNFIFASEIKPILEYTYLKREVDLDALSDFLTFLYIPSPQTMFKGIKKLPPASLLIYSQNNLKIKQYWEFAITESSSKSEEFYTHYLHELLKKSIHNKLINGLPAGVFLSGGLDSSGIVALLRELTKGPIKTFSIGYTKKDKTFNELNYARSVARYFNCEHYEHIVEPKDASRILVDLVRHMEEPFGNSSAIVTYLVCQMAKRMVGFALSGLGSDELFAGSRKYIAAKFMRLYQNSPFVLRKELILNLVKKLSESTKSRNLAGWIKGFAERGIIPQDQVSLSWFSFFNGKTKIDLYSERLRNLLLDQKYYIDNLYKQFQESNGGGFLREIFYLDVKSWLPDNLLILADKISMANSLDLYLPFCNDELLDLSTSIPFRLKIRGLRSKYILEKTLGGLLSPLILHRKRQGFTVPIGSWFKNEFKDITALVLSKTEIDRKGYFRYEYIQGMLRDHSLSRRNFADQIWALMTFELWHKMFIETDLYKVNALTLNDLYPQDSKSKL